MDELFHKIEVRIRSLTGKNQVLDVINAELKQNTLLLTRDKERLLNKQRYIVQQIETLLVRLKSIGDD